MALTSLLLKLMSPVAISFPLLSVHLTKSPLLKSPTTSVMPTDRRLLPLRSKASDAPSSSFMVPETEPNDDIQSFQEDRVDFFVVI